jgi:hypothetical protein
MSIAPKARAGRPGVRIPAGPGDFSVQYGQICSGGFTALYAVGTGFLPLGGGDAYLLGAPWWRMRETAALASHYMLLRRGQRLWPETHRYCVNKYTRYSRDATIPFFRLIVISYVMCVSNQGAELAANLHSARVCWCRPQIVP